MSLKMLQEDFSNRQRGDKNRRRRNNSNSTRNKDEKKETNQTENESTPQVRLLQMICRTTEAYVCEASNNVYHFILSHLYWNCSFLMFF